jgi:hypothetical protein
VTLLFSQGVHSGHDAGSEASTAFALRPEALLAPKNKAAKFSLGTVVRGLHAEGIDKGPERLAVVENIRATAADPDNMQRDTSLEEILDTDPKRHRVAAKRGARTRPIAHTVPLVQELMSEEH